MFWGCICLDWLVWAGEIDKLSCGSQSDPPHASLLLLPSIQIWSNYLQKKMKCQTGAFKTVAHKQMGNVAVASSFHI